jgi:hypothetical protein
MPVEDIVKNRDLLARVMSHYRHHLEQLQNDSELQSLMSNAMKLNVSFNQTIKQIEQVLAIKGAKSMEEVKKYAGLLDTAISQYAKDLEAVLEKAKNILPDILEGDLARLESELKTVKGYLTK